MSKIVIWDREESLKGIDKSVWLESYPRSATDTLVLVDDSTVYFLEDIKGSEGYIEGTDIEIVQRFIDNEERKRVEEGTRETEKASKENKEIRELKDKLKELETQNLNTSLAMAETFEDSERKYLELSNALAETFELMSKVNNNEESS